MQIPGPISLSKLVATATEILLLDRHLSTMWTCTCKHTQTTAFPTKAWLTKRRDSHVGYHITIYHMCKNTSVPCKYLQCNTFAVYLYFYYN